MGDTFNFYGCEQVVLRKKKRERNMNNKQNVQNESGGGYQMWTLLMGSVTKLLWDCLQEVA